MLSPLMLTIAALIAHRDGTPILFGHFRVGLGGKLFRCYKFRSMYRDSSRMLTELLSTDPAARAEWERDHKLTNDPRVTPVGRFLRRTSLDELPQLWNVLQGEMSLVGPRPITDKEIEKYGVAFEVYKKVNGGITGLWQVSGRNDVSYEERVYWDQFYVRNWSVWLDCCILFRTIAVVLLSKGAY